MIYNTAVEQIKGAKTAQSEFMLPILRLATVTSLSNGRAYVQFYGEATASSKLYPYISGYKPAIGDKVLVFQQGSTYIIAGKISKDNVGDTYYLTKALADTLYMSVGSTITTDRLTSGNYTLTLDGATLKPSGNKTITLGTLSYQFKAIVSDALWCNWVGYNENYNLSVSSTNINPHPTNQISLGNSSYKFANVVATKFVGAWSPATDKTGITWGLLNNQPALYPSGTIHLGTSSSNQFGRIYANQFYQNGTAISTSDRRKKTGIKGIGQKYIEFFRKLKPRLFRFKDGESGRLHSGFIAQEVEEAAAESGIPTKDLAFLCIDEDGHYGLRYEELIALQTKVIQDLMARVDVLEEKIKGGK